MRLLKQLKSSYNKRSGLPRGFTEVEYLASNSDAYIRTNIYPTDEYGYKIINTYTIGGGEQCAIGCMDSGNRFVGIYSAGNANQLSGAWGSFVNFLSIPTTWDNNTIHVIECNYKNSRKIIWNGNELKDITNEHVTGTISRPLVLFGRDSGTITGMNGKIYKVVITKGTDIVNIFIPCLDTEDTPCMYDIINKQAYYNVGSGNFSYGKKIYGIEYLESNSTNARISTGVLLDTFPFTVKTSVSSNAEYNSFYQVIIGTTNSTNQYLVGFKSGDPDFTMKYNNVAKTVGIVPVANKKYDVSTTLTATTMVMNIDGTDYSYSESLTANGEEIGLFPQNYNSSSMRIYSTQIIKNNILVADFYPVKDENNIGYMYDKVTHRLFANTGTGSFVLGSDAEQWENTSKIAFVEEYKGKLPRKYTEVEYLEATGTQYIDTGLLSTADSKVDVTFGFSSMESGSANNCAIFGGRNNSTSTTFTFFKLATGNPQYLRFDFNNQITVGTANTMDWNTTSVYRFTYDGTSAVSTNITTGQGDSVNRGPASTFTTSSITLFAVNTNNVTGQNMSGRIYHYWYTDGTTTIDLIPVLDENGKPCMYDLVGNKPYYNQGTGDDFNYGPKIKPVEYLESSGTQYIDTGYIPSNTTGQYAKMQYTTVNNGVTFGGMISGNGVVGPYFAMSSGSYWWTRWGTSEQKIEASSPTTSDIYELYLNFNNDRVAKANDIIISDSLGNISGNYPSLTLFRRNFSSGYAYLSGKIYKYQITEGTDLVRDFIPVIDENNTGYMFDKVTHTLYANKGTGVFTYGNLVRSYTLRLFRERDDIPTTYKKVSYLESTGTQYIDTGIAGSSTLKIEMIAQKAGSSLGVYFGAGTGNNRIQSVYIKDYNSARIGNISNASIGPDNEKFDIICDALNKSVIYNGTSFEFNYTTTLTNLNICIFARNEGDSYADKATAKCWSFKTWNNNILTRDFVPVIRKSDNKPGMYDRVTRTFYTNVGSGEFNYGE